MQPFQERPSGSDFELRDLLAIVRRQAVPIVVVLVVVLAAAAAMTFRKDPVYTAQASVLVDFDSLALGSASGSTSEANRTLQNEIELLQSQAVREEASEAAGRPISVGASAADGSDVIVVSASSGDPQEAAEVVNTYTEAYLATREEGVVDNLQNQVDELQEQIGQIQVEIDGFNDQLNALYNEQSLTQPNTPDAERITQDINTAVAARGSRQGAQDQLRQESAQLMLSIDQAQDSGGLQVLAEADVPTSPSSPDHRKDLLVGLAAAVVLAAAVAFVREQLDDSLRTKEELERQTGLPVLGLVPQVAAWSDGAEEHLETRERPRSAASEAYRTLLTSIDFLNLDMPLHMLQVTSASPGEGKTTTAANLAVAFADAGRRTLVVCCDLRRPRLHRFFGVPSDPGFTSILLGSVDLEEAVTPAPGTPGLDVLAAGPLPANPAELLRGTRTHDLLASMRERYDVVLLDSPPILPVADALVLAHEVDGTLVVAGAHQTTRRRLNRAVDGLRQVNAPLIGAVLNAVPSSDDYGYDLSYYGYDDERGSTSSASTNGVGHGASDAQAAPRGRRGHEDRPSTSGTAR